MSGYDARVATELARIAAALEKIANQQRAANMIAAGLVGEGVNLSREN